MGQVAPLAQADEGGSGIPVPGFLQRLANYPRRLRQFVHDVRVEMRHVNWPSWEDVRSSTLVVTVTIGFFALYFLLTDSILSRIDNMLFHKH